MRRTGVRNKCDFIYGSNINQYDINKFLAEWQAMTSGTKVTVVVKAPKPLMMKMKYLKAIASIPCLVFKALIAK